LVKKNFELKPTLIVTLGSLIIIFLFLLFLPSQNIIFSIPDQPKNNQIKELNFVLPPPASLPIKKTNAEKIPEISAESYLVLDVKSDMIMLSKNKDEKLRTASITKLMTALTAMDQFKPDDVLTVKREFSDGATLGLTTGEKLKFSELLKAILIPSANDAALTIADNAKGNFIDLMNKKAHEIHLENSLFSNPQGFDDGDNHSTTFDLARIGEYSLQIPEIREIIRTKTDIIQNLDGSKKYELTNVNELLFSDEHVQGIKTGYTEEAGECLMSLFEKDGHMIIIVLLKSGDRFGETEILANYIFSNFIWEEPQTHMP
jgi:serine-type D-Ala-D-Ala carboxypeptidase (penicillin-binding protein 5/6)